MLRQREEGRHFAVYLFVHTHSGGCAAAGGWQAPQRDLQLRHAELRRRRPAQPSARVLPLCCTPLSSLASVSTRMERGCQPNNRTLADGAGQSFGVVLKGDYNKFYQNTVLRTAQADVVLLAGETAVLPHPPPPSAGVSIRVRRERQPNESLADGQVLPTGPEGPNRHSFVYNNIVSRWSGKKGPHLPSPVSPAAGERSVILPRTPLPFAGVSTGMERGCQPNDNLARRRRP